MDAQIWHTHACARPASRPAPLTAARAERLTTAQHGRHLTRLTSWLGQWYLATPHTDNLTAAMDAIVAGNRTAPPGSKSIIGLSAANTAGKSTLARRWARVRYQAILGRRARQPQLPQWRPQPGMSADEIPIVWLNLQARTGIRDLSFQMLSYFGYPVTGTMRALNTRTTLAVDNHHVRIVIVDDVHLLDMRDRHARDVLDHLKHLNTELGERGATLVLIGADLDGGPLLADPQVAGRLRLLQLHPYLTGSTTEKAQWQQLLRRAENDLLPYLPHTPPGTLARYAGLIWRRTQGYLGDSASLLAHATLAATTRGSYAITADLLAEPALSARAHAGEAALQRARA